MKARWNVEQAAFVRKILTGAPVGAKQLDAALNANRAVKQSIAVALRKGGRQIASAKELNSPSAEAARKARVRAMRKTEKKASPVKKKTLEQEANLQAKRLKAKEKEYREAIKKLADKVASSMNETATQSRRDALAKTIRDMRANIASKKAAARLKAEAIRVNAIIQAARAQQ